MSFGQKLKKLRESKNLTQTELAEMLSDDTKKYTQRIISYYEREEGGARIPPSEILEKVASFFDVSVNYLIDMSENKAPELQLLDKIINLSIKNKIRWQNIHSHILSRIGWLDNDNDYYIYLNELLYDSFVGYGSIPTADELDEYKCYGGTFDNSKYDFYIYVFNSSSIYLSIFLDSKRIITFDDNKINGELSELLEVVNSSYSPNQLEDITDLLNELDNLED